MLLFIPFLPASDPASLGKVDKSTFSQLALMEILAQDLVFDQSPYLTERMRADEGNLQTWPGVSMNTDGDVTAIEWSNFYYRGQTDLQWLPLSVEKVKLMNANDMVVFLNMSLFPDAIRELQLSRCTCPSSVDLTKLPQSIERVWLIGLDLGGTLPLDQLPATLYDLQVAENAYTGTACLTKLPDVMTVLYINDNTLHGTIDLTSLPFGMETLNLSNNSFAGETDFSQLPMSLEYLDVAGTNLSGEIVVNEEVMYFAAGQTKVKLIPF